MDLELSLNEVTEKSTQALKALGYPAGIDVENGKNIGWLASRGLPGLRLLFYEINTASQSPLSFGIHKETKDKALYLSSSSSSAFELAQSAVDFAQIGNRVIVNSCRFPLLIFAEMARREHLCFGFTIKWWQDGKINKGCSKAGSSAIYLTSTTSDIAQELEISSTPNLMINSPFMLNGREISPNSSGIAPDRRHWACICNTASTVLVSDSKESYSSAGPEVDDYC